MQTLLEILNISGYKPIHQEEIELAEMFSNGSDRKEALAQWVESGRSESKFRKAYKKLKDRCLNQLLIGDIKGMDKIMRARLTCWSRFAQSKSLLIADKRKSASVIGEETVRFAEKYGQTEIVLSVSKNLLSYYSIVEQDAGKFRRYRKKIRESLSDLVAETNAHTLYSELVFMLTNGKDVSYLHKPIVRLRDEKCNTIFFKLAAYSSLSVWYSYKHQFNSLIMVCQAAIDFFEVREKFVPYVSLWNFKRQIVLGYLVKRDYARAEKLASECIEMPKVDSHNWNVSLLLKAKVGLYSGKYQIAAAAYRRASYWKRPKKTTSVSEHWEIVSAWVFIYKKATGNKILSRWSVKRFLNSVPKTSKQKDGHNVNVLIVRILYYFFSKDFEEFVRLSDNLKRYCSAYLTGGVNIRQRCFLLMLSEISDLRYKKWRVEKETFKLKKQMSSIPIDVSREWIPFEQVWEMILDKLD